MKTHMLLAAALSAALFSPVMADGLTQLGLDDPEVTAPAGDSWTSVYAGLSYGRTGSSTSGQRCFKLDTPKACDDPIFETYPQFKRVETFSTETSSDELGAFVGYRHDFGRIVGGIELSASESKEAAELQLGLDLSRVLVYGLAGTDGYGAGADVKLGKRLFVGAKYVSDDGAGQTTARFGFSF